MNNMVFRILALATIFVSLSANADFKLGPTGGIGGYAFEKILTENERLCGLNVYHGNRINAIQLRICDKYNNVYFSEILGSSTGTLSSFVFQKNEFLTQINTRTVSVNGTPRIAELGIWTNLDNADDWGGYVPSCASDCQNIDIPDGYEVSGFFGRRAEGLDSVGVTYRKITAF